MSYLVSLIIRNHFLTLIPSSFLFLLWRLVSLCAAGLGFILVGCFGLSLLLTGLVWLILSVVDRILVVLSPSLRLECLLLGF